MKPGPDVAIVHADEPWTTLHLADGSQVKIRPNVFRVRRNFEDDGKLAVDEAGNPSYNVDMVMTMNFIPSDKVEPGRPN